MHLVNLSSRDDGTIDRWKKEEVRCKREEGRILFIPLDISANITKQFVCRNIIGEAILKSQRDIIGNLFLLINFRKHIDHNGNDTVSLLNMLELNLVNMEITIAVVFHLRCTYPCEHPVKEALHVVLFQELEDTSEAPAHHLGIGLSDIIVRKGIVQSYLTSELLFHGQICEWS